MDKLPEMNLPEKDNIRLDSIENLNKLRNPRRFYEGVSSPVPRNSSVESIKESTELERNEAPGILVKRDSVENVRDQLRVSRSRVGFSLPALDEDQRGIVDDQDDLPGRQGTANPNYQNDDVSANFDFGASKIAYRAKVVVWIFCHNTTIATQQQQPGFSFIFADKMDSRELR